MKTSDKIVISGIAGRFPECENVDQFKEALLNGVDLVTENDKRYPAGIYGIPRRSGVVPEIDKFDNAFFEIHATQANFSDPRHRILLETVYECIVDAGYNPHELRGSKTGVYVGVTPVMNISEVRKQETRGYSIIGFSTAISANRVSYCFDFKGPSFCLDTGCSSGMYAFTNAVKDLESGKIDSAVVGVAHLILDPEDTKGFLELNMLSPDGKSKVFQSDRDGYVRAETIASFLLQRESRSRRVYATVLGSKVSADGYKKEGLTFPSFEQQMVLLKEVYEEANLDPIKLSYVETHGTGTQAGDKQECMALSKILTQGRSKPLPIGSVKSNMGHSEASSALSSLTKIIIAMESGVIPGNLHAHNLDMTLPGISDNKLKPLTENLSWDGGIVGVNSFGFGGANAHLILKSHGKQKKIGTVRQKNRLVLVSGRTEEAVLHFLKGVEEGQNDEEFLALVDEIHKNNIEGHPFRGFVVLGDESVKEIKKRSSKKRLIWFIYAGMGSQWIGMGRDFMGIKTFRQTFLRCAEALKPYDIDLEAIIMDNSPKVFENIMNAFVAITSVQVALTEVLLSLGIYPDGIAGHSLGETVCGYADGSLTAEEAVLLSYARGKASTTVPLPAGLMAAVELTVKESEEILPENTFIGCRNGKSSLTISGLDAPMRTLVEKLKSQGSFAKIIDTRGIAYHSKYVANAGPVMMECCNKAIQIPKPRSPKWISTSVPDHKVEEPWARMNCPEYHFRNFMSPVLFDRVYKHVPEDALVVEIAPHELLQAILKKELGPDVVNVSMASRLATDNEKFLLTAIGRMYLEGIQPNLRNFYTEVSFPVSRGTKMLSHLVKWDHSVSWFSEIWKHPDCFGHIISINVSSEKYSYLRGHCIDGRVVMPATGYLEMVWMVMAKMSLKVMEELTVVMEDIRFKRVTVLPDEDVQFLVNIFKQSGHFEIFEGGSVVVSGKIRVPKDVSEEFVQWTKDSASEHDGLYPKLTRKDLYKEFHLRGYMYKDSFQAITECDIDGTRAKIEWSGMFTSFMDAMLHPSIIVDLRRELSLPTSIEQLVIDPVTHLRFVKAQNEIPFTQNRYCRVLKAGGIEIVGLNTSRVARRQNTHPDPYLEDCHFIYYNNFSSNCQYDLKTSLAVAFQIIIQNSTGLIKKLNICEVNGTRADLELNAKLKTILEKQMMTSYEYIMEEPWAFEDDVEYDVIILDEKVAKPMKMESVIGSLSTTGFVLWVGGIPKTVEKVLQNVFQAGTDGHAISLLRPKTGLPKKYEIVNISNTDFGWLEKLKDLNQSSPSSVIYLVSQGETCSGIIGLTKCLLAEDSFASLKCVFIDQEVEEFFANGALFRNQLEKNLTINVMRNNHWGTFVYLSSKELKTVETTNASLSIRTLGDLSTFSWIQRPVPASLPQFPNQELVQIYYSVLNFRDVSVAMGSVQKDSDSNAVGVNFGWEYSGVTPSGRRVMGVSFETIALQLRAHPNLTWDVPETWSLQEAATVPLFYSTCYYAMIMRGQMKRGESILIQAGSGGVGIAAISIALSMDATVFTTVSNQEKRDFLKKMFPKLEDKNFGNSKDKTFQNLILNETKGRGVDLVLNSLVTDLFQASLRCIAKRGRFLEIGKKNCTNGSLINSSIFLKDCSFHGIQLDDHFGVADDVTKRIHELINEGIKDGVVKPLPATVFNEDEVEKAFRFLSTGKHIGKVLIKIRDENSKVSSLTRTISATPKVYFDSTKSYVLIGGLGSFGLELANWMIQRGATKIVFNSRRKILNGYQGLCFKKWALFKNVVLKVNIDDTGTLDGAKRLVEDAQKLGPVGGVFNTILDYRDGILANQTRTMFEEMFKCKIVSGRNMDAVTRRYCPDLEQFVMFSSISGGRGTAGQTNSGMANSALERLCEERERDNLPGLAVQWGPIEDVGILTNIEDKAMLELLPQHINSCLGTLETFMLGDTAVASSIVLADKTVTSTSAAVRTPAEATAHILGIKDLASVDKSSTLTQLGMDSLMVAKIKQTLYRNFRLEFSVEEIRLLTIESLTQLGKKEKIAGQKLDVETLKVQSFILSDEAVVTLNEWTKDDKIVFFVHPVEGLVDSLRTLAKKTKATVYGLQCTKNSNYDSLPALAGHFVEQLKKKQLKGPYRLCGYSYGVVLSLEIALRLEGKGEEVTIIALDGSLCYVKNASKITIESKIDVLKEICVTFQDIPQTEFADILEGTWEEALRDISTVVARKTGLEWDLVNSSFIQYYNRRRAVYFYEPKEKIRGKVTFIRAQCDNQYTDADDYGLQEVCHQKVDVFKVPGDHNTIVMGESITEVSKIINDSFTIPKLIL